MAHFMPERNHHYQFFLSKQRIPVTVNTQEQKRLLTDLDVSMRTADCPYAVTFYGALFREGDVWICMECMDTSLDKFYSRAYRHGMTLDEDVLGRIAFAVSLLSGVPVDLVA